MEYYQIGVNLSKLEKDISMLSRQITTLEAWGDKVIEVEMFGTPAYIKGDDLEPILKKQVEELTTEYKRLLKIDSKLREALADINLEE